MLCDARVNEYINEPIPYSSESNIEDQNVICLAQTNSMLSENKTC